MRSHGKLLHTKFEDHLREGLCRNWLILGRFGIFRLFSRPVARVNLLQRHSMSLYLSVNGCHEVVRRLHCSFFSLLLSILTFVEAADDQCLGLALLLL